MPTDVIMPQMGESIVEGTITKWLKKPGDKVQRDEPLFEISTDKVDAEIPAPAAGILREIKVPEGATVDVNTVVGVIDVEGSEVGAAPAAAAPVAAAAPTAPAPTAPVPAVPAADEGADETFEVEGKRIRSSPLVRRIAKDSGVSLAQVAGTGLGGRITKQDILSFLEKYPAGAPAAAPTAAKSAAAGTAPAPALAAAKAAPAAAPMAAPAQVALTGNVEPLTKMRKIIADRMIESRRTSAHVHCMFEVDLTRVVNIRNKNKSAFEQRHGAKLTFMPFFVRAAMLGIQKFPIINSSMDASGDNIIYHRNINVGIAVALDWGLIVPVLKSAEEKSFLGLQRGISDLGERARGKKLMPDEIQGSTFTVTNPGQFGAVFGLPIINQPNVAILGVGGIAKQPMVVTAADGTDSIAIRSTIHLVLGYDHRVIDGAVADMYMAYVKQLLENWNEEIL